MTRQASWRTEEAQIPIDTLCYSCTHNRWIHHLAIALCRNPRPVEGTQHAPHAKLPGHGEPRRLPEECTSLRGMRKVGSAVQ